MYYLRGDDSCRPSEVASVGNLITDSLHCHSQNGNHTFIRHSLVRKNTCFESEKPTTVCRQQLSSHQRKCGVVVAVVVLVVSRFVNITNCS